jgi:integrase
MSVRKRTWFTRLQLRQIEPKARGLAKSDKKPADLWKAYIDKAAAALEIERNQAWIIEYADHDGDRHIETFALKKDADKRHAEVTVGVYKGTHTAPSKSATVAQACKSWIDRVTANGMKGRGPAERATIKQYREHIKHIVPRLDGTTTKLAQLNRKSVEQFQNRLLSELSRPLAKKVFTSFKSMLKVAGQSHIADGLSIGTPKRSRKIEAGKDFPTAAEVKRMIDAATGKKRVLLLTATLTGLRASELRGLRWKDIDFKAGELHVRQRADRYNEIGEPKSDDSARTVPLDPGALTAALKEWKLACPKGEEGLVFPSSTGRIEYHKNMLHSLTPVMKAAGVVNKDGKPKYALHAFRHFFASWCINPRSRGGRELPAKEVQSLLGHASIVLTMDVYGHMFPTTGDRRELAASAAALLG